MSEIFETRKQWIDIIQKTSAQYDNTIVWLSAGAIAVSLSFLNNVSSAVVISYEWALLLSWVLFCCALMANLLSYLTSQKGYLDNLNKLDKKESTINGWWNNFTVALNVVALMCFLVGMILLLIFSFQNLKIKEESYMNSSKKNPPAKIQPAPKRIEKIPQAVPMKRRDFIKGMPVISNPKPKNPSK